jgi:hypothetical protein
VADPISKINKRKIAGGVAQVIDYLPPKHKALSLDPSMSSCIKYNTKRNSKKF